VRYFKIGVGSTDILTTQRVTNGVNKERGQTQRSPVCQKIWDATFTNFKNNLLFANLSCYFYFDVSRVCSDAQLIFLWLHRLD